MSISPEDHRDLVRAVDLLENPGFVARLSDLVGTPIIELPDDSPALLAYRQIVEAFGGTARQACDAAAISFQNTMGSVCDLVQGVVEIPCHTRNAVAASSAFV